MASRNTPVPSGKERRAPLVMVVDDESINVKLISALLTERGYDVLPALSGEEALARKRGPQARSGNLRFEDA
jgi:CheY-like chemotaxis protein